MAELSYYVDKRLKKFWTANSLERMKKTNNDRVYIVDGRERTGKTWWATQQMGFIEPELLKNKKEFLSRICFTPDEFYNRAREVKNGVIIFDEAFRGLSSRQALSKTNKKLIQTFMEMGQNNNIVFIVLPAFFLLDIYPAMLRSDALFNIYLDKKGRRAWRGYNRKDKNIIYQVGIKKGWTYVRRTYFTGRFYGKFPSGEEFEKAYLKKKSTSFVAMEVESKSYQQQQAEKFHRATKFYQWILHYKFKMSIPKIGKLHKEYNLPYAQAQIHNNIVEVNGQLV